MVNIFIENYSQIVHIEDLLMFYNSKLSGYLRWTDPYCSFTGDNELKRK